MWWFYCYFYQTVEEAIIENGDVENKTKKEATETTETANTFSQDDFDKIVKNFAADLKSSLKDAFKPP